MLCVVYFVIPRIFRIFLYMFPSHSHGMIRFKHWIPSHLSSKIERRTRNETRKNNKIIEKMQSHAAFRIETIWFKFFLKKNIENFFLSIYFERYFGLPIIYSLFTICKNATMKWIKDSRFSSFSTEGKNEIISIRSSNIARTCKQ